MIRFKTSLLTVLLSLSGTVFLLHGQPLHKDTLAIISINDFHGSFVPDFSTPGAASILQEVVNVKQQYKHNLTVSAGDNFNGTYFSRITRGAPIWDLFAFMELEASAVGNHEFYWPASFIRDTASKRVDFIAANIQNGRLSHPDWLKPYKIVTRTLGTPEHPRKIKIALVGLTTTTTALKALPDQLNGAYFTDPMGAACSQTLYYLRKEEKPDLIILVAHAGSKMNRTRYPFVMEEENTYFLPYVPHIHAVISGHSHDVVLEQANNVPIIQAGERGQYIGKLLFEISQDEQTGTLTSRYLGGDTIKVTAPPHPQMQQVINTYISRYGLDKKLAKASAPLSHNWRTDTYSYTPVGAYVTASYAWLFQNWAAQQKKYRNISVVGIHNFGGIRTSIPAGDITALNAGNVLPFPGNLEAYRITGQKLKRLIADGLERPSGYLQSSYLEYTLLSSDRSVPAYDRITAIKINGIPISDQTECVVVTERFVAAGGDGYSKSVFEDGKIEPFCALAKDPASVFMDYLLYLNKQGHVLSPEKAPSIKVNLQ